MELFMPNFHAMWVAVPIVWTGSARSVPSTPGETMTFIEILHENQYKIVVHANPFGGVWECKV